MGQVTSHLVALLAGLLFGGIAGVWVGGAGRVWRTVFAQWVAEGEKGVRR